MAKGRMLQKRISNSRKMALLSSDTARLLYTWILPHLDINGCFYADPVMVNNIIFTRLQKPIDVVSSALDEMEGVGLIIRYEVAGEVYLTYPDFGEKQPSLQVSKEGRPTIPPPTPDQLQSKYRVSPPQNKRREEKLREAKATLEEISPVDNCQEGALLNAEKQDGGDEVKTAIRFIEEKRGAYYAQQCMIWLQTHYRNGNRRAVIHCLNQVVKGIDTIDHPKAYLEAAFKIENGKKNAEDHDAAAQEYKKPVLPGELNALGAILGKMGKGA